LLQVGILSHQAKSGRLIVRLTKEVRPGSVLLDDGGRKLGRIVELIGPVRSPYASITVSGRPGKKGDPVFIER